MAKRKAPFGEMNTITRILLGALIMAALTAALSVAAGMTVSMLDDPLSAIDISALAVQLLASAISGFALAKMSGEQKMLVPMLSGLLFSLMVLVSSAIVCGGITLRALFNFICYLGVLFIFSRIGAMEKKGRRQH